MLSDKSRDPVPDTAAVAERLRLLELDGPEAASLGRLLQESVIRPNVDSIVASFGELLGQIELFNKIVSERVGLGRPQTSLRGYLRTLGVAFDNTAYFDERRRIGKVHQQLGIAQSHYQCAMRRLQDLLIEHVPATIRTQPAQYDDLLRFILKITALDMSLAVEGYCDARVSGLKASLRSQRGEAERLRKLSITDWLTSLHNHSYSRRSLTTALEQAQRRKTPLCIIMADLDHFKEVNDTHGHLVGDEVLRIAAARMISGARSGDRIARYGGEEFLFILTDTEIGEAQDVAERVRARISSDAVQCGDSSLTVTMSLGLAEARSGDSVDDLIDRADAALYAAKAAGRDCVRVAGRGKIRPTA